MSEPPKTTRTVIRLKHSLAADEEINAVLPHDLERLERELAARGIELPHAAAPPDAEPLDRGVR